MGIRQAETNGEVEVSMPSVFPSTNTNAGLRWGNYALAVVMVFLGGWYAAQVGQKSDALAPPSTAPLAEEPTVPATRGAIRGATTCPTGKYCRQLFSWRPSGCLHTYRTKQEAPEAKKLSVNERFLVDSDFVLTQHADANSDMNSSSCAVYSRGTWSSPISPVLLNSAAEYFVKHPRTNCSLDLLETPGTTMWNIIANAPSKGANDLTQVLHGLGYAELRNSNCALIRLTDLFDVLAHLHAALAKSNAVRGGKGTTPRIDLVGDESHRALFFRIVSFMRRQPVSFDLDDPGIKRVTYRIYAETDEIIYQLEELKATPSESAVLFEMNFIFHPDDAEVASLESLSRGLDGVADGIAAGNLVLAVLGVAYKPSNDCVIDSKPFADGLLKTYKAIHDFIEDVMPLNPRNGITYRNATGFTLISKTARVPDTKRSDMVTKRNSHARHFLARHRRPHHTIYLPHDTTDADSVPLYHTERRIGLLDVHRFLAPTPHPELEYERYGDPARAHSACILKDWTTATAPSELRSVGNCRDWINLGVFQLMLTYALADNPQWSRS